MKNNHKWTKDQIKMFGEYYEKFGLEIATQKVSELLGEKINKCVIINYAYKNGYHHLREDMYTEEQKEFVRQCYEFMTCEMLVKKFNERFGTQKTESGMSSLFARLGLNTKCTPVEIGKTTIWKDKEGRYRKLIKIENDKLIPYQNYLWEKHTGKKVPKGYKVTFKDGDYSNFDINNLACVSQRTHAMLNFNDWRNKGEITNSAIMLGELIDLNDKERYKNVY